MQIDEFWQSYLDAQDPVQYDTAGTYEAWSFGNTPEMADDLGALVLQGIKTATASLVWAYEHEEERYPRIGDLSIILDSAGKPLCIIETTQIEIGPFNAVDERQAYEEGEGDRTLAYWRKVHWEFFSEECESIGKAPNDTMPILCERFKMIFP